jgi:hypothetical protein
MEKTRRIAERYELPWRGVQLTDGRGTGPRS